MKSLRLRLLAVILAAALTLTGCGGVRFQQIRTAVQSALHSGDVVAYADMEYERPDVSQVQKALEDACREAAGEDTDAILEAVYAFYDAYDWFYLCYSLADIRYCGDLTDIYWEKEYSYCVENSAQVDGFLEELYYALAQSPCREELETESFGEGFFDSYDGENLWDEEFTRLLSGEGTLENRYYDLTEQGLDFGYDMEGYYDAYAEEITALLIELVKLRKEIAAYWGYESYWQYAGDVSYYRDYTEADVKGYLTEIQQQLVPLYRNLRDTDVWNGYGAYCPEEQTMDYVRKAAENMGGTVKEAFDLLEIAGLYDIGYGENKYPSSFEVYLTYYWEPFIFMNPELTAYDQLTFAHEFGHFCCDYASYGSYAGVDVLEVFSQGMEYLSLCYGEDTQDLTRLKMADSLCTYVEQAAFADFELRLYDLPEEELTVEAVWEIYDQVARSYGFDSGSYDRREFVDITHFFTEPMYVISYVVSNDAAMQLYQLEQDQPGEGRKRYEAHLDTQDNYFLAFLENAGLESPFAPGRVEKVRQTFENVLQ